MARCTRTTNLEVHHKRRDGGNDLPNAEVLCHTCHVATSTYVMPGTSPPRFSAATRDLALLLAGYRCERTRTGGCY